MNKSQNVGMHKQWALNCCSCVSGCIVNTGYCKELYRLNNHIIVFLYIYLHISFSFPTELCHFLILFKYILEAWNKKIHTSSSFKGWTRWSLRSFPRWLILWLFSSELQKRITEKLRLEGNSGHHLVQPPQLKVGSSWASCSGPFLVSFCIISKDGDSTLRRTCSNVQSPLQQKVVSYLIGVSSTSMLFSSCTSGSSYSTQQFPLWSFKWNNTTDLQKN